MPKEQTLELEMDLNWITSGFHFVLDSKVRPKHKATACSCQHTHGSP